MHQGTVGVDVLLEVGFVYDRDDLDFSWLESALLGAGFVVRPPDGAWRWWTAVDGVWVKLELLCDAMDNPSIEMSLPGCSIATAMNLRGPAPAFTDSIVRALPLDEATGRVVEVRFAGLGGYLLAKAAAVVRRGAPKDYYDFAFVLIHNISGGLGGAGRAAWAALPDRPLDNHAALLVAAPERCADIDSIGADTYAEQRLLDGVDVEPDILRQDAVGAADECRRAFEQG